ncbi:MAG: hypothetical protein K0R72_182 [Clostridia bacterium]|jgi:hypothetical protein|nr:hypothetical protein [Clostridia bacterium]
MASSVSYELLQSKQGTANGLATLDANSKLLVSQLPAEAVETYKGEYATSAALIAAHATGLLADYAYVTETNSYWYWNEALAIPAWVNQQITEAAYLLLSASEKAAVPYTVVA